MNKRKNKLMSMTSKIFEPPKNRNAYTPYTDSEGNILKEEDIQFTDTTGFRGRRSMIWDEDDDETYTDSQITSRLSMTMQETFRLA